MNSKEIRLHFLEFFKSKEHKIEFSAPIVVKDDPTLMFTNAGMNQFKEFFVGNKPIITKRIANSQKCLRVSGKHNDLGEVGHDTYHHTMFEMLGNWSFGDYFKKEAISWAWELLTEVYKIPKENLYVTIFEGDSKENLEKDTEAYNLWAELIDKDRILLGNKKDNFWEMGEQGPCGPCSEIHIDLRDSADKLSIDGKTLVNNDHPLVVEVWNLVFMQFNRKADGSLERLPNSHVDTGMGFERLCMALQKKKSNYDTDVFQPIIKEISRLCGKEYGKDVKIDIAMRVIADHLRTISFSIADGQLPSNVKAGYVIRRILRRAVRYGCTFLEFKEPFIYKLLDSLISVMGDYYPELLREKTLITSVIKEEENSFLKTLERGIALITDLMEKDLASNSPTRVVKGEEAFLLYDTFGFPLDLTELIAFENGFSVDLECFKKELSKQKERSRNASSQTSSDWIWVATDNTNDVEFIGYNSLKCDSKLIRYREIISKDKKEYQLVLSPTPFYAKSGGQVGDKGTIFDGSNLIKITDTLKENNLIIHLTDSLPKIDAKSYSLNVDSSFRQKISSNHSATHLMHYALRKVLGSHIAQKGSYVDSEYLRFDFSHFQKVTEKELLEVEKIVNDLISLNIPLTLFEDVSLDKAKELNAIMLFGEKYTDKVRVIKFEDSVELCGGTHIASTGLIRLFKIRSESAVSAGVRRIEALSNIGALNYYNAKLVEIKEAEMLLGSSNLQSSITKLKTDNSLLKAEVELFKQSHKKNILQLITDKKAISKEIVLSFNWNESSDMIRDVAFSFKNETLKSAIFIYTKSSVFLILSKFYTDKGLNSGALLKSIDFLKEAKGGGQPFFTSLNYANLTESEAIIVLSQLEKAITDKE